MVMLIADGGHEVADVAVRKLVARDIGQLANGIAPALCCGREACSADRLYHAVRSWARRLAARGLRHGCRGGTQLGPYGDLFWGPGGHALRRCGSGVSTHGAHKIGTLRPLLC